MKIGRLIIERNSDEDRAKALRENAAIIRRGGLGRIGERSAQRKESRAARLERGQR